MCSKRDAFRISLERNVRRHFYEDLQKPNRLDDIRIRAVFLRSVSTHMLRLNVSQDRGLNSPHV